MSYNKKTNEELVLEYQKSHDVAVAEQLYRQNIAYLRKCARYWCSASDGSVVCSIEDLVQEGYIGMLKAAELFDDSMNAKFLTYAEYWVDNAMRRFVCDNKYPVRLPVYLHPEITRIKNALNDISEGCSAEEKIEFLCDKCDMPEYKVKKLISIIHKYCHKVSLDDNIIGLEGICTIIDSIPDETAKKETLDLELRYEYILGIMQKCLTAREYQFMTEYYGVGNEFGANTGASTLESVAKNHGVTKERVRQVICKAERKIKQCLE